jgi:hypothetical protein
MIKFVKNAAAGLFILRAQPQLFDAIVLEL